MTNIFVDQFPTTLKFFLGMKINFFNLWICDLANDIRTGKVYDAITTLHGGGDGVGVKKVHLEEAETALSSFHCLQMFGLFFILCKGQRNTSQHYLHKVNW